MPSLPYDLVSDDPYSDTYDAHYELIMDSRERLRDVLNHLYSNEPLDRIALEDSLDDLCKLFSMRMPDNFLNIERRKNSIKDYFLNLDMKSLYVTNKTI